MATLLTEPTKIGCFCMEGRRDTLLLLERSAKVRGTCVTLGPRAVWHPGSSLSLYDCLFPSHLRCCQVLHM